MKIAISIIFQIVLIINLSGQIEFDKYYFVKADKLNLRSEANTNSKVLTTLSKGEKVRVISEDCPKEKMEKIDGMLNCWAKVEANKSIGYMFMGYLDQSNPLIFEKDFVRKDFVLLTEGFYEGLKIPNGLNWYGVFSKSDGEYLEEIKIDYEYIEYGDPNGSIKLFTDFMPKKSKFIIGAKNKLESGLIGIPLPYDFSIFIFPHQKYWLPTFSKEDGFNYTYFLSSNMKSGKFENYNWFIEEYHISMRSKHGGRIQPIKELNYRFDNQDENTKPLLVWYGDVDKDNIPDWMIKTCQKECGYQFFLSSIANEKDYVKRIEK